ncbi:histidine phosphatase family protein [Nioella aestuarii]|uniref:histidine phosphatase family protein n=1 Tax=Nioella aestuarii TaxID=1662864 RepID=UPI003D7F30C3
MTTARLEFPELWVLRHGETEWNTEERLQGLLDSPLTAVGLDQARAQGRLLAAHLSGPVRVISSDAPRAMRTAEIAVSGLGLVIESDPRLAEINLGRWQGRTVQELRAEYPDIARATDPHLWKFGAPGGETLGQMSARVQAVLEGLTGPTVLVTHGVTSRLLRCIVLGIPVTDLASVPGGQGVVHHIRDGKAQILSA